MLNPKNVLVSVTLHYELLKNGYWGMDISSGVRTRYCTKFFTSLQVVVHGATGAQAADTTTPSSKTLLREISKLVVGTRRGSGMNY